MSIGIVVGTFGSSEWERQGKGLAEAVAAQEGLPTIHSHGAELAEARNLGAAQLGTDYLIFLDADDNLEPGYGYAMNVARERYPEASIFQPSTRGVRVDGSRDADAILIPDRNMFRTNSLVIGSMVRAKEFFNVGGFKNYDALEDWEMFLNMICFAGAWVVSVPDAVYAVTVNPNSRNAPTGAHDLAYIQISRLYKEAPRREYWIV